MVFESLTLWSCSMMFSFWSRSTLLENLSRYDPWLVSTSKSDYTYAFFPLGLDVLAANPFLLLWTHCWCLFVRMPVSGGSNQTALVFLFNTHRHLALIKERVYWAGLSPRSSSSSRNNGYILIWASSWVRRTQIHSHRHTPALLLRLMPRSVLLSSYRESHEQAEPHTVRAQFKLLILRPEWKTNNAQRTS